MASSNLDRMGRSGAKSVIPGLNLDALLAPVAPPTEPVTLGDSTWQIRTDFSTEIGLNLFMLITVPLAERVQEVVNRHLAGDPVPPPSERLADMAAVQAEYAAESARVLSSLLRFSGYAEMTPERVADTFTLEQQGVVLAYFFGLRTAQSSQPSSDGTATSPTTPENTPTQTEGEN